jgi:hypothetical protein
MASANVPPRPPQTVARRRVNLPGVVLVLAVVGVALAGAYLFLRPSDAATPGEVVTSFVQAAATADIGEACDQISDATLDRIESDGRSCEDGFEQVIADSQQAGDDQGGGIFGTADGARAPKVEVVDEEVEGDRAQVTVRIGGDDPDPDGPILLVREDGHWKIDLPRG